MWCDAEKAAQSHRAAPAGGLKSWTLTFGGKRRWRRGLCATCRVPGDLLKEWHLLCCLVSLRSRQAAEGAYGGGKHLEPLALRSSCHRSSWKVSVTICGKKKVHWMFAIWSDVLLKCSMHACWPWRRWATSSHWSHRGRWLPWSCTLQANCSCVPSLQCDPWIFLRLYDAEIERGVQRGSGSH